MVRFRDRVLLGALGAVVLVMLVGVKMTYRGWAKQDQSSSKAQTGQSTPMVWPPAQAAAGDAICHSAKLTTAQANRALEEGIAIDPQRRCITKAGFAAHEEAQARHALARERSAEEARNRALESKLQAELEQAVAQQVAQGGIALQTLAQAREGKVTRISSALLESASSNKTPLPKPPAELFVAMPYQSGDLQLAAFVTPNPGDRQRHPAIIWLTGGDSNSLDDFWTEGSPQNDQSASAFYKAGMVAVFPTLRGGNTNPGQREYLWGEVDDVIAAILQTAKLPYVDPGQIYLGGHSTGGTLALLVASTGLPIQGVFAFGPVADPSKYAQLPVQWDRLEEDEKRLRSPKPWLHAIKAPTWIIEGTKPPSNSDAVEELCGASKSDQVHCVLIAGQDHLSVLQPLTRRIAAQVVMGQSPKLESTGRMDSTARDSGADSQPRPSSSQANSQ